MKVFVIIAVLLVSCGYEELSYWGDRYIDDSCMRCPDCCANAIADREGGDSCEEENADIIEGSGWSKEEIEVFCKTGNYPP